MKTRRKNEESSKSKLSLQKKKETVVKKNLKNILSISHNSLNETCEFQGNSRNKEQSKCQVTVIAPEEEAARNQVDEESDSLKKCPTCELSMPLEVFQHHVSDCLKDRFQLKGTNEDEETRDKFVCQFCLKDLSCYNSTRKTQHLNRCMDQIDELKQKETQRERELEHARMAVLDCPMCGKTLKTENGRKVHIKKCSQSLGVSTDQLLVLIKQQEEERQVKIAAGVVPDTAKAGISKLNKQAKKKKLREPQSKYDEELQTALAISNSLCKTASSHETETHAKKQGKKKGRDPVSAPLVVLLSEEDKQKRRSERVATMLIPQESDDEDDMEFPTPVLPESQIQENYTTGTNKFPSLWSRCELSTEGLSCHENKDRFYVEDLMPPITVSRFVVGSSRKKMADIPGRRKSSHQRLTEKQAVNPVGSTSLHGDTMLASTQTAVVLAELEVGAIATSDLDLTCSGFCPDSPIKVQEHTRRKTSEAYQRKMVSMVNNPALSDVKIRTCDSTLFAHRLVLSVQCPSMLTDCDTDVDLTQFSTDAVLAVLKFLYAGMICLPKGSVPEIKQLATRLEIGDLVEICSSVLDNKTDEDQMERNPQDPEEERDVMDLQRLLDEEDTGVDTGEDEGCKSEDNHQEEISNEEYNDIRCTQRKKFRVPEGERKDGGSEKVGLEEDVGEESEVSEAEISLFFHDDSFNGTSVEAGGDKVGSEGHSESENVEGIKESKFTSQDQSARNKIVESRGNITKKDRGESITDESVGDMEVDRRHKRKRKKARREEDERHQVEEKHETSILYQDEEVIIYSETEDTPNCSESERDRKMSKVDHQSGDLDRSGSVSSPLLVDSDASSHDSLEENEEPPALHSLDSSGLDLFESPLSLKLSPEADDNQSGSQSPYKKSPAPCRENSCRLSTPPDKQSKICTPGKQSKICMPGKQSKICTPVKVISRGGSRKIMRRSNLDRERYETTGQQRSGDLRREGVVDPRREGVADHIHISGDESSAKSKCGDDVVSLIDDDCQGESKIEDSSPTLTQRQSVLSPVFSLPSKERKTFRFTKTKAITASLQKVTSPCVTEEPDIICCDEETKSQDKSPCRQHENEEEGLAVTGEDEIGLDCQAADVWEDFDDSGMGGCVVTCDFPTPSCSANESEGKGITFTKYNNHFSDPVTPTNASSVSKQKSSHDVPADPEVGESFGDDSFDVDMVLDPIAENQNSFKTPTDSRRPRISRKEWVPPSPFTPMPEFEKMATPLLKQEVQKIGVKPVGKKRMLLLLKDVYKQTHQYETDSEFEVSVDEIVTEQNDEGSPISVSDEEEINSSQDSQGSVVLEESMVTAEEEVTSSQAVSDVSELTQKILQFIHDTPDLHRRILQYEPLELDSLKREITSAGIKCSMDKLMNFLDEKCITFTMKNRRKGSPRKGRGRGRKKAVNTE